MEGDVEIGTVQIFYSEAGIAESAGFTPTLEYKASDKLLMALMNTTSTDDASKIKYTAEMLLSGWFNMVDEIEIADRELYKINSRIIECEKYTTGIVKRCVIKFFFTKIKNNGKKTS